MAVAACLELQLVLNTVEGVEVMRALDEGPLTMGEVRRRTGVDVLRLARTTRALVSYGVLARRPNGEYARTDISAQEAIAQ